MAESGSYFVASQLLAQGLAHIMTYCVNESPKISLFWGGYPLIKVTFSLKSTNNKKKIFLSQVKVSPERGIFADTSAEPSKCLSGCLVDSCIQ